MLKGIDDVDWNALTHAYGPAGDVPRHLQGLASPDMGEREAALEALYGSLWHQGTLYAATAAAIPFLLALVDDDATRDRPLLLLYLADVGRSATFGDEEWYADTQAALAAGVDVLRRRLTSADEVERIAALVALAWADDGTVLKARLSEGDEAERLVTLYAYVAGRAVPDAEVLRAFADSDDPGVRLAARIGLGRAGDAAALGDVDPEAYALLAEVTATVAPQALPQPIEVMDPPTLSQRSVQGLAAVLEFATSHRTALPLVVGLLEAALPDGWEEPATPLQLRVLTAIANSSGAWVFDGNTLAALAEAGIDAVDRIDLCARLNLDTPEDPESEDTQSLLLGSENTGIRWEELSNDQRRELERFVDFLDQRGWNESRNWHTLVQAGSLPMSPIGVGRHFNEHAVLEATLWFFDEHVADDTGERVGDPYVRLLIADKAEEREPIGFRAYHGDRLLDVLEAIDRHRPTLDRDNFAEGFPKALFEVCGKVEVELPDGRVVEIRPKSS
ncbi:MAG: hypothetical protein H6738_23640 [Alphaproteobacteria bacterium]|nr:hypothetical protein [Alphaproteobacteria bacterium]MCB9699800.1 hypothetical protein [Alphaproteobacteria bacterium]